MELKRLKIKLKGKIFVFKNTESEPRRSVINRTIRHGARALLYYSDPNRYKSDGEKEPLESVFNKSGVVRRKITE